MKIAVVIPCYNSSRYLGEALASVFAQTRKPDEVIVVDDGSTDNSMEIARGLGATVLSTGKNSGPASARNIGIRHTSAELIAFLDSDDVWKRHHLETLLPAFERDSHTVLAFGRMRNYHRPPTDQVAQLLAPRDIFLDLLATNVVVQSATVARRSAILAAGGYPDGMRYSEDYSLWLRLAMNTMVSTTDIATCRRRTHDDQLSRQEIKFVFNAFSARAEAIARAEAAGHAYSTDDMQQAVRLAFKEEFGSAVYRASWPFVEEIMRAASLFPWYAQDAARMKARIRNRWPYYVVLSALRWLKGVRT